jgi:hypothetical protein
MSAIKRGEELVNGLAACGFCHSTAMVAEDRTNREQNSESQIPALSGGRSVLTIYGDIGAPNITPDSTSGGGQFSDYDLRSVFRAGLRPDGSEINSSVHRGFEWLSDTDVFAIISYLRSLPGVNSDIPRFSPSIIERNTSGIFDTRVEVKGYVPAIPPQFKVEFGGYLVDHVARCGSCHNTPSGIFSSERYLAGGKEVSFDGNMRVAPAILGVVRDADEGTESGRGAVSWGVAGLRQYLRSGVTPDGRSVDQRFCPTSFYSKASDFELDAMVSYLTSDLTPLSE